MADTLEKLRRTRGTIRGATTKILKKIEEALKESEINADVIEEHLEQLEAKRTALMDKDSQIQNAIADLDELDREEERIQEWMENIILWKTRAARALRKNAERESEARLERQSSTARSERSETPQIIQPTINLPRLNLEKFSGDISKWQGFWGQYEIAIHQNSQLAKTEKFAYLKSYLEGSASNAISGLPLSDANYDSAISILKDRFGRSDLITNSYMQKLLRLQPVKKSSDIISLRQLYDECEIQIRNLEALGVETQKYGVLLCPILMEVLPEDIVLELNRKKDTDGEWKVNDLLLIFRKELESRERAAIINRAGTVKEAQREERHKGRISYDKTFGYETNKGFKRSIPSAAALNTVAHYSRCLFCNNQDHGPGNCERYTVSEKRDILKKSGRCYVCLYKKHPAKFCQLKVPSCLQCGFKHHKSLCINASADQATSGQTKDAIVSSVTRTQSRSPEGIAVVLQTVKASAAAAGPRANSRVIRCLLDGGSQRTFIREDVARDLKLPTVGEEELNIFTFGSNLPVSRKYSKVKVTLRNILNPSKCIEIEALETPTISSAVVHVPSENVQKALQAKGIMLSDACAGESGESEISALIGSDYYWRIVSGTVKRLDNSLVALDSIFGFTLQGPVTVSNFSVACSDMIVNKLLVEEESLVSTQLREFWELDSLGIKDHTVSPKDDDATVIFDSTIEYKHGRYEVGLPWRTDKPEIPNNYQVAKSRLMQLARRFNKDAIFYDRYNEVMNEQLKEGILEEVIDQNGFSENDDKVVYYLPHHAVVREDKATSKLRIVYDASSHQEGSPSLNDCLLTGPNLNPDLLVVLLKFRLHKFAFMADITKAFLQISLSEQDRDAVRLLWFKNSPLGIPEPEIKPLRLTRVLFGARPSPFLLAATIRHHLGKMKEDEPKVCQLLDDSLYVDDFISGSNSEEEVVKIKTVATDILASAGMELGKWRTNSPNLNKIFGKETEQPSPEVAINSVEEAASKVLGLCWRTERDDFFFNLESLLNFITRKRNTKRFVLQTLARIFDPIGFLGPFTFRIKHLIQELWLRGVNWDEPIPTDLMKQWERWCTELPFVQDLNIPRWYFFENGEQEIAEIQLHIFSDSSEKGYGCVAYLRFISNMGQINTSFVCGKNRIAPLKRLSLPRLELMGALIASRLNKFLKNVLPGVTSTFLWTDSTITLYWIRGRASRWKQFVANRVAEIQASSDPLCWSHCPGTHNPADLLTRGESMDKLKECSLWWEGPAWLRQPNEYWPKPVNINDNTVIMNCEMEVSSEAKIVLSINETRVQRNGLFELENYSKLSRVLRVTSWIFRFIWNCKNSKQKKTGPLEVDELNKAEVYWIKTTQAEYFVEEILKLQKGEPLDHKSKIRDLFPYLDNNGIICLKGRLQESDLDIREREPWLLPRKSKFTELLIIYCHQKLMHTGLSNTLAEIREKFWILCARRAIKSILSRCVPCKRMSAKPGADVIAPLPKERIVQSEPFATTGLDFFGPLYVKKNGKTEKVYVLLLTCAVTRSVHLELVPSLSTNDFLLAFRKFIARRGICTTVYSDNGKTFKCASTKIKAMWKCLNKNELQEFFGKTGIKWIFITERAPWWGGFWEKMVSTVKSCLKKSLGKSTLTNEEMDTTLVEAEAVINSRPITFDYNDVNEPRPLTPAHFLIGHRLTSLPPTQTLSSSGPPNSTRKDLIKRLKYRETLLNNFWRRWQKEYLLQLRSAYISPSPKTIRTIKVGDLVIVHEDKLPRQMWKTGRVTETFEGRDKRIRSCAVKVPSGRILKRPIQLLSPLEVQ